MDQPRKVETKIFNALVGKLRKQGYLLTDEDLEWLKKQNLEEIKKFDLNSKENFEEPKDYWDLLQANAAISKLEASKQAGVPKITEQFQEKLEPLLKKYRAEDRIRLGLIFQKLILGLRTKNDIGTIELDLLFVDTVPFNRGTLGEFIEKLDYLGEFSIDGLEDTLAFNEGLFYDLEEAEVEISIKRDQKTEDDLRYYSPYSRQDLIEITHRRLFQLNDLFQYGDLLSLADRTFFVDKVGDQVYLIPLIEERYLPVEAEELIRHLQPQTLTDLKNYSQGFTGFILTDNNHQKLYVLATPDNKRAQKINLGEGWEALVSRVEVLKKKPKEKL